MLLKEEINKYLNYCKFQKELDDKTIKANCQREGTVSLFRGRRTDRDKSIP